MFKQAIQVFKERKARYDAWYARQDSVSVASMMEREELAAKCDWAIQELQRAQARTSLPQGCATD